MKLGKKKLLENLYDRYKVLKLDSKYSLYDKTRKAKYGVNYPFVAQIELNNGNYIYNDTWYKTVEELSNAIDDYIEKLPYNHEFDDPMYNSRAVIEMRCDEYLINLGLTRSSGTYSHSVYEYRNPLTQIVMISISVEVDYDKKEGKVVRVLPGNQWMEVAFDDADSAISAINSMISSEIFISTSGLIGVLDKMNDQRTKNDITMNHVDMSSFKLKTQEMKDQLIKMLEKELETLKSMK